MCSKSVLRWKPTKLWSLWMAVFDPATSFPTNVFSILQHMYQQQKQVFGVTLWSI
jgi:uncharacterized membrane protein (DUF2068 family)